VCPNSDGACAVIFASQQMVKKLGIKKAAWVKGVGFAAKNSFWRQ